MRAGRTLVDLSLNRRRPTQGVAHDHLDQAHFGAARSTLHDTYPQPIELKTTDGGFSGIFEVWVGAAFAPSAGARRGSFDCGAAAGGAYTALRVSIHAFPEAGLPFPEASLPIVA
jgi:hypothetical protein